MKVKIFQLGFVSQITIVPTRRSRVFPVIKQEVAYSQAVERLNVVGTFYILKTVHEQNSVFFRIPVTNGTV